MSSIHLISFIWVFKAYVAIYLVTNTFNITMAVFDVGQHVVNNAAGVISGNTAVDASEAITRICWTQWKIWNSGICSCCPWKRC